MAGGYRHVQRGARPMLQFADDVKAPYFDSAWEANTDRVFAQWYQRGWITGYSFHPQKLIFLTSARGNAALEIDYEVFLPRQRQKTCHPWWDVLWDLPRPHGMGAFKVIVEVKGRLKRGGLLAAMTTDQWDQLQAVDAASTIKLQRLREKYSAIPTMVIGAYEYHDLTTQWQSTCPDWEST